MTAGWEPAEGTTAPLTAVIMISHDDDYDDVYDYYDYDYDDEDDNDYDYYNNDGPRKKIL